MVAQILPSTTPSGGDPSQHFAAQSNQTTIGDGMSAERPNQTVASNEDVDLTCEFCGADQQSRAAIEAHLKECPVALAVQGAGGPTAHYPKRAGLPVASPNPKPASGDPEATVSSQSSPPQGRGDVGEGDNDESKQKRAKLSPPAPGPANGVQPLNTDVATPSTHPKCAKCKLQLSSVSKLWQHLEDYHRLVLFSQCATCGRRFPKRSLAIQHQETGSCRKPIAGMAPAWLVSRIATKRKAEQIAKIKEYRIRGFVGHELFCELLEALSSFVVHFSPQPPLCNVESAPFSHLTGGIDSTSDSEDFASLRNVLSARYFVADIVASSLPLSVFEPVVDIRIPQPDDSLYLGLYSNVSVSQDDVFANKGWDGFFLCMTRKSDRGDVQATVRIFPPLDADLGVHNLLEIDKHIRSRFCTVRTFRAPLGSVKNNSALAALLSRPPGKLRDAQLSAFAHLGRMLWRPGVERRPVSLSAQEHTNVLRLAQHLVSFSRWKTALINSEGWCSDNALTMKLCLVDIRQRQLGNANTDEQHSSDVRDIAVMSVKNVASRTEYYRQLLLVLQHRFKKLLASTIEQQGTLPVL